MVVTNRIAVIDECSPGNVPLANVTVYLYGGPTVLTTQTDVDGFYRFEDLPPGRYSVFIDRPTCTPSSSPSKHPSNPPSSTGNVRELRAHADNSNVKTDTHVFHKKGDVCEKMSSGDQIDAILLFDSLDECCANMFWFDMTGCISRSQHLPQQNMSRFYPTWIRGQLCSSKETFDDWEDTYFTLQECCESHFSWDYSACCASSSMGGCHQLK